MTEEDLEKRIRKLYHAQPTPDPQRLAAVLRRLETSALRQPRYTSKRWLPWLLLACTATAAAAGYHWFTHYTKQSAEAVTGHTIPNRGLSSTNTSPHESSGTEDQADQEKSPARSHALPPRQRATVIYMR